MKHQQKMHMFLQAISPIVCLSQTIGVSPIKLLEVNQLRLRLKSSIPKSMHTLLLFTLYTCISLYEIIDLDEAVTDTSANVFIFREIVNKYFYFVLGCTCVVLSFTERNKVMEFIRIIYEVDRNLCCVSEGIDYRKQKKKFLLYVILGLIMVASVVTGTALIDADGSKTINKLILLLILIGVFGQLIASLQLLRDRFALVNREMNNSGVIVELKFSRKLKILAVCHDRLCDAAGIINGAYTLQLLALITLTFLTTLFAIFSNFRFMFGEKKDDVDVNFAKMLIKNSLRSVFMVILTVTILHICSTTCSEANETGKIVHKIINNNPGSSDTENLKTLSLQLMHRNLSFNACYMFPLDYTLLYTLVAASTTYMVILIQFDLAKIPESKCNSSAVEFSEEIDAAS